MRALIILLMAMPAPLGCSIGKSTVTCMPGCDFTRRDMLRWTAFAAAAAPLASVVAPATASAAVTKSGTVTPVNLELVTLAEDHAVITWFTGQAGTNNGIGQMVPAPADGEVRYGTHPARLNRVAYGIVGNTPYHYVELTDLEPGQTYYYQATSNGVPAAPSMFTLITGNAVGTSTYGLGTGGPYSFTTPQPPRGSHLFTVILCNDLHMGETQAGLVGGQPQYIGIEQVPGLPPYPEVMLESLVQDVRRFNPSYLLAAGDISAEAVPTDLSRAGTLLNQFGEYQRDYFVVRGNHDRAHVGDAYATCRVGQWQGNDCFHDAYFPNDALTYFSRDLSGSGLHVIGLDTYDKAGGGGDAGGMSATQLDWFQSDLAKHKDQPTIVFGHHPLIMQDSAFPISSSNSLDQTQAASVMDWYAKSPGVFLHHAGHTHRNHLSRTPSGVVHQEILGYWPQFAFGNTVADRNLVAEHDLSGLRRVAGLFHGEGQGGDSQGGNGDSQGGNGNSQH